MVWCEKTWLELAKENKKASINFRRMYLETERVLEVNSWTIHTRRTKITLKMRSSLENYEEKVNQLRICHTNKAELGLKNYSIKNTFTFWLNNLFPDLSFYTSYLSLELMSIKNLPSRDRKHGIAGWNSIRLILKTVALCPDGWDLRRFTTLPVYFRSNIWNQ